MRGDPAQPLPALDRLRLRPNRLGGSQGTGERRSRHLGAGMEFADFRPYATGDDLRHVDPHLYLRSGDLYIRRYQAERQMPVVIVLDTSASMALGGKHDSALAAAAVLAQVTLAGGDSLRLAAGAALSPQFARKTDIPAALGWLATQPDSGKVDLDRMIRDTRPHLPPNALIVVISDFWSDLMPGGLHDLAAAGAELWTLQLLSPEELRPDPATGTGLLLADVETGEEVTLAPGEAVLAAYARELDDWCAGIARASTMTMGRHLLIEAGTQGRARMTTLLQGAGWIG